MLSRRAALAGLTLSAAPSFAKAQTALTGVPAPAAPSTPSGPAPRPPILPATRRYALSRGARAVIIRRNGVVLAEAYADGATADSPEPLGDASRLYAAVLAAALERDNLLELGEPVAFTIGEWGAHPRKQRTTVRDLLTLASGLTNNGQPVASTAQALSLEPVADAGMQFLDDGASLRVFGEIARRKASRRGDADVAAYLTRRVLARIAAPATFSVAPDGAPILEAGAATSPRALSDVGELLRRRGVWRARQVLDGAAIQQALSPSGANPRYGMGFWLSRGADALWPSPAYLDLWRPGRPALPDDLAVAAGENGARLYLIPSRALTVVRFGANLDWSDVDFLNLLLNGA